jgi:hypothetical protein
MILAIPLPLLIAAYFLLPGSNGKNIIQEWREDRAESRAYRAEWKRIQKARREP